MLMARLATYKAKPNGSFLVEESEIEHFLDLVPVNQLPGIGWHHQEKLDENGISTCKDLRKVPLDVLKNGFGAKMGEMLYNYCRGIDNRELENKGRQSLGVDINWGVRFQNQNQVSAFFRKMTEHVCERLKTAKLKASHITVKAKKRLYQGEPSKFLGCGHCESLSKSSSMPFTDHSDSIYKIGYPLLCKLSVDPIDLRGIGLSVKMFDLQNTPKNNDNRQQTILKFLSPIKAVPPATRKLSQKSLGHIDQNVFEQLPLEIQQEIRDSHRFSLGDALSRDNVNQDENSLSFVTPQRKKRQHSNTCFSALDAASPELTSNPGRIQISDMFSLPSDYDPVVFKSLPSSIQREIREEHQKSKLTCKQELDMNNLMPSSSQLDLLVLNELPDSIKKEVLDSKYRKHRDFQFLQKLPGSQESSQLLVTNELIVSNFSYPALGGETDPFAIYELLNDWIGSSPNAPQDEGVVELKNYLKDLAQVGDLVRIRNIMLFLERRLCIKLDTHKSNTAWNTAYSQIYGYIHQIIKSRYGAQLSMKI
jgi:DNA repair protein REV1